MAHLVVSQSSRHDYLAAFTLMVLGSACIPVPSEAVMRFSGALNGGVVRADVHVHSDDAEPRSSHVTAAHARARRPCPEPSHPTTTTDASA
ncbi:MAG: hypothetical protein M0Z40_17800 [Actinomycetota bacterium]|jgi:hypothetical protein|nr:hypothetical protein [Actinomycetota bacterium]MDA8077034.1 hypothetical protein [Actinomycetota bacterium]